MHLDQPKDEPFCLYEKQALYLPWCSQRWQALLLPQCSSNSSTFAFLILVWVASKFTLHDASPGWQALLLPKWVLSLMMLTEVANYMLHHDSPEVQALCLSLCLSRLQTLLFSQCEPRMLAFYSLWCLFVWWALSLSMILVEVVCFMLLHGAHHGCELFACILPIMVLTWAATTFTPQASTFHFHDTRQGCKLHALSRFSPR